MLNDFAISEVTLAKISDRFFYAKDKFHIFIVSGGNCIVSWDKQQCSCGPDTLILMQPDQQLSMRPCSQNTGARVVWLRMSSELLRTLSDSETDLLKCFSFIPYGCTTVSSSSATSMLASHVATRFCDAYKNNGFGNKIMVRGMLSVLIILVLRICIEAEIQTFPKKRQPFLLDSVFSFIREHLEEPITLKRLGEELFISHEYISRAFKKQTGQTVHNYILQQRLERSCRFLREGVPVVDVWKRCGFNSYAYFFQAFKKRYGVTPKSFAVHGIKQN